MIRTALDGSAYYPIISRDSPTVKEDVTAALLRLEVLLAPHYGWELVRVVFSEESCHPSERGWRAPPRERIYLVEQGYERVEEFT